jgi:hypothetical protein
MNNVDLANGDQVGVACPWTWPELFDGMSTAKLQAVQRAIAEGDYRKDPRSEHWVGNVVATVLGMDPENDKKRIGRLIKEWVKNGVLVEAEGVDEKRMPRVFVEVGRWVTE